uniref:Uncharacterized protein n=1 Tax=Panagrellus redivivus TaxID=6233 RepID=A0A7E4VKJ6_PANRE
MNNTTKAATTTIADVTESDITEATTLSSVAATEADNSTTFIVFWLLGSFGVIAALIFIIGCLYLILRHVNIATREDPNKDGQQFGVKKGSAPQSSVAINGSKERPFAFDKKDILAISKRTQNPQAPKDSSESSRSKLTATIPYAATPIESTPARSPGTEIVKTV